MWYLHMQFPNVHVKVEKGELELCYYGNVQTHIHTHNHVPWW